MSDNTDKATCADTTKETCEAQAKETEKQEKEAFEHFLKNVGVVLQDIVETIAQEDEDKKVTCVDVVKTERDYEYLKRENELLSQQLKEAEALLAKQALPETVAYKELALERTELDLAHFISKADGLSAVKTMKLRESLLTQLQLLKQ